MTQSYPEPNEQFIRPPQEKSIQDRCPWCGHETLFISDAGFITCSWPGCTEPNVMHLYERLSAEIENLRAKLAEYEGDNKRWHSFETVRAIAKERDAANQRVAVLERERDELQKLPFTHSGPEDCPCWYDYCHCNVDTLRDQIKRAAQAEAELKFFRTAFPSAARNWSKLQK